MRVLLVTNILTPYRCVFYDKLFNLFAENGVKFTVWVMAETEDDRVWTYQELKTEYTILLHNKTIKIKGIRFHFNKKIGYMLAKCKPDIVIAAGSYFSPSVISLATRKKSLGYKLIFWSESHLDEKKNNVWLKIKLREFIRHRMYKKFDGFWYAGQKSLELIKKYCNNEAAFFFVPNLVDGTLYKKACNKTNKWKNKFKTDNEIEKNKFIFICPARLTSVKGIIPFLNLLTKFKYKNRIAVLIAGDGEMKADIQQIINAHKLNVHLLGQKNQNEIVDLYSIADAFLMPSLSDPNPLTCIEAIWAGLPLLVSEHVGNHPEVICQGKNGFVFSYNNEKQALYLLEKLIFKDKAWHIEASKVSSEIAQNHYDLDVVTKRIVNEMII